jgi:hypothetical protein
VTQSHEQLPSPDAVARGYEGDDLNNNGLLVFLFFFLLTAVVLHTAIWVLLKYYLAAPRAEDKAPSAVELIERFPSPQLQPSVNHVTTPAEDLAAMRRQETAVFQQLGWQRPPQSPYPVIPDQIIQELKQREAAGSPATEPAATTRAAKEGRP